MIALDFILMILTITCIVYCMVLNKRIMQIQKYKADMLKIFKDFDKSVEKAERILDETRNMAPITEEALNNLSEKSQSQMEEFEVIMSKADKLAEELETIIISGNKLIVRFNEAHKEAKEESESQESFFEESKVLDTITTLPQDKKITLSQQDYYEILQHRRREMK